MKYWIVLLLGTVFAFASCTTTGPALAANNNDVTIPAASPDNTDLADADAVPEAIIENEIANILQVQDTAETVNKSPKIQAGLKAKPEFLLPVNVVRIEKNNFKYILPLPSLPTLPVEVEPATTEAEPELSAIEQGSISTESDELAPQISTELASENPTESQTETPSQLQTEIPDHRASGNSVAPSPFASVQSPAPVATTTFREPSSPIQLTTDSTTIMPEQIAASQTDVPSAPLSSTVDSPQTRNLQFDENGTAVLELDGRGWVFVSGPDEVKYSSKKREESFEEFIFVVLVPGEYVLNFHRQNLVNGSVEELHLPVEFSPMSSAGFETAADLAEMPIAMVEEVEDVLDWNSYTAEELEEYAQELESMGDIPMAISALEFLRNHHLAYYNMDGVIYKLASLYEIPGPDRNIRHALGMYRDLINVHPFSLHQDEAEGRIRYIQRTYYKVF